MNLTKVEYLDDRVRVHYHLQKPYAVPDEDGIVEVLYESVERLPGPPERVGHGRNWREEVYISRCNRSIVFLFDSYCESFGPNEHTMYGPYIGEYKDSLKKAA